MKIAVHLLLNLPSLFLLRWGKSWATPVELYILHPKSWAPLVTGTLSALSRVTWGRSVVKRKVWVHVSYPVSHWSLLYDNSKSRRISQVHATVRKFHSLWSHFKSMCLICINTYTHRESSVAWWSIAYACMAGNAIFCSVLKHEPLATLLIALGKIKRSFLSLQRERVVIRKG